MTPPPLTIAICARNAAETIERAVASVLPEAARHPLLLIDDHCTDNTVALAKAIAGDKLKVITHTAAQSGLAQGRQTALMAMTTKYGAWLDADDEWVPGRADRFSAALEAGFDITNEAIDLFDGPTNKFIRRMDISPFIARELVPVRLFERNYLPCDSQTGFRVEMVRACGGYEIAQSGPESFNMLLRAVKYGARFYYGKEAGYKMYSYPNSLSRKLDKMRAALAEILKKHDYEEVRQLCLKAGYDARGAAWVLVSMAMFRYEPQAALGFLDQASPAGSPNVVLEPEGPWPFAEGWRRAFQRGTILLLATGHDVQAAEELKAAYALDETPEGANNLGVALARLGDLEAAKGYFAKADELFPGYLDAKTNAQEANPVRITTHPLRRQASRSEYSIPKK